MTRVNPKFIEVKQKRLDEKDRIYVGELNYKNMTVDCLWGRLSEKYRMVDPIMKSSPVIQEQFKKSIMKDMADISNFCGFIWERLAKVNETKNPL